MTTLAVLLISFALTVIALVELCRWAERTAPRSAREARIAAYEVDLYGEIVSVSLRD